ncbi:MAG: GTPase Era [Kiritimatiellae bacterium]|nr:GTPase Era [Kiritimatiellia bacterium]
MPDTRHAKHTPDPASAGHARSRTRCAVVGVIGRTNSGKSTLVNRLLGEKISIVSPVVQTTRNTIRGILDERRGQLVLVDTPGLHKAETKLGSLINRMARHAAANVDMLVLVLDGSQPPRIEDDGWMRRLLSAEQPCFFLLNKCDRPGTHAEDYRLLWQRIQDEKGERREVLCLRASAATGEGLASLVDALFEAAQPGERLYDRNTLTDYPRRLAIADAIREKYLMKLRGELPHELGVRVDDLRELPEAWAVEVSLLVNRPSQKPIVIGEKGRMLRDAQRAAERELSEQFGTDVKLSLRVKVEKNWMTNTWILRQMGYAGEY